MILYHGTSTEHLSIILANGLQPREVTGVKSNWDGDVESKPDLVYLTTSYPVYFAIAATKEGFHPVVLEVEVAMSDLFPDEDFVAKLAQEQDIAAGVAHKNLSAYNPMIDPIENKHLAQACLTHNGIAAVREVGLRSIKRNTVLPQDMRLLQIGGDSAPIPMNFKILGESYRKCMEALFDEGIDAAVAVAMSRWEGFSLTNNAVEVIDKNERRSTATK